MSSLLALEGNPVLQQRIYDSDDGKQPSEALLTNASRLIKEAETLLSACRVLIDHLARSGHELALASELEKAKNRTDSVQSAEVVRISPAQPQPQSVPDGTRSERVSVDLLEVIMSRFPDVISGASAFLAALIQNSGRIVQNSEMQMLLGSVSSSIIRVHASRIRKSLHEKRIYVHIMTVRGGYALSKDNADKIIAALNLTPDELNKISPWIK